MSNNCENDRNLLFLETAMSPILNLLMCKINTFCNCRIIVCLLTKPKVKHIIMWCLNYYKFLQLFLLQLLQINRLSSSKTSSCAAIVASQVHLVILHVTVDGSEVLHYASTAAVW